MSEVIVFPQGGFRFLKGMFQYSAGVAAEPGFEIERARFARPIALREGFERIAEHLARAGRPPTAFCACELRSPEPFSEAGFVAFNREYVPALERWGLYRDEVNPVARSNVCPEVGAPPKPSFYAFSYTVPSPSGGRPTFVIAGSGEAPEGAGDYRDRAIRLLDRSSEGMREKARWVLGEMERRLRALGLDWSAATGTQVYTVFDLHPFLGDEILGRGAAPAGLTWHFARPPVKDLDYEMDVRGVAREIVL